MQYVQSLQKSKKRAQNHIATMNEVLFFTNVIKVHNRGTIVVKVCNCDCLLVVTMFALHKPRKYN